MARLRHAAVSAFLLAAPAGGAVAQFSDVPMVIRLPYPQMDALPGRFSGAPGDDLLVLHQTAPTLTGLRPWHDLLQPSAHSFQLSGSSSQRYRAGYLAQNGGDALADVARPISFFGVGVVFGNDPTGTEAWFATAPPAADDSVASPLRLLPRSSDVLVVPVRLSDVPSLVVVDPNGSTTPPQRAWSWTSPTTGVPTSVGWHEAFPARLSAAARSAGIDDIAIGVFGGVLLVTHRSVPTSATLGALDLTATASAPPVLVGGYTLGLRPPWLPASAGDQADTLGVAALDVDLDGAVDLVITNATVFGVPPLPAGTLLLIKGTGNPADFGNPALTPWSDLGRDVLGLVDPLIVRGMTIAGQPSFAVWDRALQEVLVVTPDPAATGGLRVWSAPAPGERAVDIHLADLAGSAAPDLVVVMSNPSSRDAVLVYPDLGDPAPDLGWAPGSPGTPTRGADLPMAVVASDDGGPPHVDWIIGDPAGAPVAQGLAYTYPGANLCTLPPPPLAVTVRATDAQGVFTELQATLPVATPSPDVRIASPGGRLVLAPGGSTAVLEGTVALACGATATWGGTWPAGATFVDDPPQGATVRRTVTLPEATYPDLLAGPTYATLTTSDPVPQPVSTLAIDLDASGLVEVSQKSDRPLLAQGDLAVLKTEVRSRIGVPLPLVRVIDVLTGLAPAGNPSVSGASVVDVRAGGAEVVVDALPAAPAELDIALPVSSLDGPGATAVEVRSSGGFLLTPPASAPRPEGTSLGCGCGSSPGGALALLALLALLRPARPRRRARPPLT